MRAIIIFISAGMLTTPAIAEDTFFANKKPIDPTLSYWSLSITSKSDPLIIQHIDVNRGCKQLTIQKLPLSVPFGQEVFVGTFACDPIEVAIQTPNGNETVNWEEQTDTGLVAHKYNLPMQPMTAEFANFPPTDNWSVIITNVGQPITINSVVVNKGHCPYAAPMKMPEVPSGSGHLGFGDRYGVALTTCNPLSVTANTDQGPIDFDWDN